MHRSTCDAPKTRPFGADSTQPTQVFGICYGLQELFGDMKDKGKGHEKMKQGLATGPTTPQNCEIYGGFPSICWWCSSFKNVNTFWQVVFVAACG